MLQLWGQSPGQGGGSKRGGGFKRTRTVAARANIFRAGSFGLGSGCVCSGSSVQAIKAEFKVLKSIFEGC